jgi:curved DNA-binding protein CbpA
MMKVHRSALSGHLSVTWVQAYRKLSLKYHPDRNKDAGATQMFRKLTEAKDILLDVQARAAFLNMRRYALKVHPDQSSIPSRIPLRWVLFT